MLELDSMEMIVYITIKATVPRLVVLELVRIHFSLQRDQKGVQNFLANYFRGTVLISKVFWKTIPYFL